MYAQIEKWGVGVNYKDKKAPERDDRLVYGQEKAIAISRGALRGRLSTPSRVLITTYVVCR